MIQALNRHDPLGRENGEWLLSLVGTLFAWLCFISAPAIAYFEFSPVLPNVSLCVVGGIGYALIAAARFSRRTALLVLAGLALVQCVVVGTASTLGPNNVYLVFGGLLPILAGLGLERSDLRKYCVLNLLLMGLLLVGWVREPAAIVVILVFHVTCCGVALFGDARSSRSLTRLLDASDQTLKASRSRSDFLHRMTHELRTPLTAMIGYAELIEEEWSDDALIVSDVGQIQTAAYQLLVLVNNVLDLAKIEAGRLELKRVPMSLDPLIRTISGLEVQAPPVLADALRVEQALRALHSECPHGWNAVEATSNEGLVVLDLDLVPDDFSRMQRSLSRTKGEFFELSGLRLPLAEALLRSMQGEMRLDTGRIRISLPRAR